MPSLQQKLLLLFSGAAFSPSQISGLVSWHDASDAATLFEDSAGAVPAADNADVVGMWRDKSGNGYHVTQATTADKPTLRTNVQNGKSVVRGDGSTDFMQNTSYADFGNNYTIFAVARYAVSADILQGMWEITNGAVNTGFSMYHEAAANWRGGNGAQSVVDGDLRDGNFRIHEGLGRGSGSTLEYFLNGASQGTTAQSANANTLNTLGLFRINAANWFLVGDIAELIIYNRSLSADERTRVRSYLNTKWAVY